MAELTLEQQRALALARARVRVQQQARPAPAPKKKEEEPFYSGFLPRLKEATGNLVLDATSLLEQGLPYLQQAAPIATLGAGLLGAAEKKAALSAVKQARAETPQASREEEARQQAYVKAAKPGLGSEILAGIGRAGAALPSFTDYDIGALSKKLLPQTPEAAAKVLAGVEAPFQTARGATEFAAQQIPSTLLPIGGGKLAQIGGRALLSRAGREIAEDVLAKEIGTGVVATGGVLNAASAGRQAYEDVIQKGGTEEQANRAYKVAAAGAGLASAVASRLPGLEQQAFATEAVSPGIIRNALRSAAGEAPQEFIEESGAQLATNVGKLGTPAEVPIGEDVLTSGLLGAVSGVGMSAPFGAYEGFREGLREEKAPPLPPAGEGAPPPAGGAAPIRTTTITYPNREDPTNPIKRTIDVLTAPDADGYIAVRDDTGRAFEMKAADLDELEAASPAYEAAPTEEAAPATPAVDRASIMERMRLASGTPEGKKPAGRVVGLANDITTALEADDPVTAQAAIQSRMDALAASRMSETTRAQRQAEIDEAQSIVNDYRVEFARTRAAAPARVEVPTVEPSSIEQAREQNAALAAEERANLERESAFETASLIGQGSPIRQAQTERQQLFDTIINDDTIENPAAAFRQALAERGYPNTELNEAERRQVQARAAFTAAPAVTEEPTEVPAAPSAAPPEVAAGAAEPVAEEPGVAAVPLGEEPKPSAMSIGLLGEPMTQQEMDDYDARKKAREEARDKLREVLKGFGFKDITVIVRDLLGGGKFGGLYDPMDSIIRIAMKPDGALMESVLYHELVHYLKDHGFFSDAEWKSVLKFAKRDLFIRGIVEYSYRGETRASKDEEIVAEAFRAWMAENAEGFQKKNNMFAKARRFLNAIRDFFFSQNLRDANAVFDAIRNGEFATREDKGSAARAEYYAGTAASPGRRPMYAGLSITEEREGESPRQAEERRILANYYQVAQDMETAGADPKEIRVATGWERNPYDNEWRYLQPDDMAYETQMLQDFIRDFDGSAGAYTMARNPDGSFDLQDVMQHSDLYSIYPDAKDIRVFLDPSRGELQGSYNPKDKSITLYTNGKDPLGTLLHEVQHWVQDKEGFAFGSSPSTVWKTLSDDQKRSEAATSASVLRDDVNDLAQIADIIDYLRINPEFEAALADGTALSDLEGFFEQAFNDGVIVDDYIYGRVQERLEDIVNERAALGLANPDLVAEDLTNELKSIDDEINQKNKLIEDINAGDPTEVGSDAEAAARTAFNDHTRRNVIRYLDTAGEIEARDVAAQKRKGRGELRETGMLKSETAPPASAVVVRRKAEGPSASEEPNQTVTPETTKGAKLGFLADMRNFMSDLYRQHLYKYSGALKLDEKLKNALGVDRLPKEMSLEDRMSMFETMRSGLIRDFKRMWLEPFKRAIKASGIDPQDLSMYLWARSAAGRNQMVAERNRDMPDGGSGLTNLDAEAILSFYKASGLMRKLEPLVKMHDQLVDWMLKQRVKHGLMSKEEADFLRKQQPYYASLKGHAADGDMFTAGDEDPHENYPTQSQLGVRPKDYIKTTGRVSMPFDPVSNLISDAMQLTQRIARNDVGKRFLSIVRDFPDLLGDAVKIYTDDNPKIVNKGIAPPGSKKKTVGPMNMAANAKKFLVVKENGKNFYIEFNDKTSDGAMLKRMFENMNPKQLEGVVKFITRLGNLKKQLLTRFFPPFWAWNFGADAMDAIVTGFSEKSRLGSPVEGKAVALRTMKYLATPSTWSAVRNYISGRDPVGADAAENVLLMSQMVQDGGESGRQYVKSAEDIAKEIRSDVDVIKTGGPKDIWGKANKKREALVRLVDRINEFLGLIPRFAAYKAALDAGVKPDDAAKFALDSTLNLARKGEATDVVDNIYLFTNPAAQSLEKKTRIYKSKNGRRALAAMMGLGVALHFFNMAMAGDSDDDGENDYQEMDEATKLKNLVIYTGDGPPLKLPLGFLVAFEVYLGQQLARMATNDSSGIGILQGAANAWDGFFSSQIPAGDKIGSFGDIPKLVVPDVFTFGLDLYRNKNAFDSQIYPEPYYKGQAVSGMARESTGEFYKKFASALNRWGGGTEDVAGKYDTPAEGWQYAVNQNLLVGGASLPKDFFKYITDNEADITKAPIIKRFVGDNREYAAQNKYYDRIKKVEIIASQYEGENQDDDAYDESKKKFPVESDPSVIDAFKEAQKSLRGLNKELRDAQDEGGPNMAATIKDIRKRRNEVYVNFNKEYNRVKQGH